MKIKYRFEDIENGVISEGYTSISVVNHVAEIDTDNAEEIKLAQSMDGQRITEKKPSKKRDK